MTFLFDHCGNIIRKALDTVHALLELALMVKAENSISHLLTIQWQGNLIEIGFLFRPYYSVFFYSGFQLGVESNSPLLWVCTTIRSVIG